MPKLIATLSLVAAALFTAQIAKADTCSAVSGNLVTNCGFETGSFSGWSGTATTNANSGVDGLSPYSGNYEAYIGGIGSSVTLYQTINTTAGSLYRIVFALMNDTSPSKGYTNLFAAAFGGTTLLSESAVVQGGYIVYSYLGLATSSTTILGFAARNDGGDFELDSISVTQAPEPSSLILLGTGALGLLGVARRRLKV